MTKRAVLLISIVMVICFSVLGNVKPVHALPLSNIVMQIPPSDVWVDPVADESPTSFKTIQAAVNAVAPGGLIHITGATYNLAIPITINKPLYMFGVGSDSESPLINGKFILASQGSTLGIIKLFNFRFGEANGAITIGDAINASFDQVELNKLTFGTVPQPDTKAIQTASSVQIKQLSVLDSTINAAHGIDLNGDFGSVDLNNNTFNLTAQTAGSFDAIKITQDTKATDSVNPLGKLTIQANTLNKLSSETYPFASAILNQTNFTITNTSDAKRLSASGNSFAGLVDQTKFIQDKVANFVLVNNAPVANSQTLTTAEDTDLDITLSASDAETDPLTYALVAEPEYGTLSGTLPNLTYTPIANYSGVDSFSFKANDGKADSNPAIINITVSAVNDIPVLTAIPVQVIDEGDTLTFTAAANDIDLPEQQLTFSLEDAPIGASIDPDTGIFTWTPTEIQGPQGYTLKVCVSDGEVATPSCQDVAITVNEVNLPPILSDIPGQTVKEGEELTFAFSGSDPDLPAQTLSFTIINAPTGSVFDSTKANFTWTPVEGQGSQTFKPSICVSDGVVTTPTCQEVTITVESVNSEPTMDPITSQSTDEGALLSFSVVAYDTDLPKQDLTYSFSGKTPSGIQINASTGVVTWSPSEEQGGNLFTVNVCVSDGLLKTCQLVVITIKEVNVAPTLVAIPDQTVAEGELLVFTAAASDVDLPEQELTFTLEDAPIGASIDPDTGIFAWSPSEEQGPMDLIVKVCVSDGEVATPSCQDVAITVNEVNLPPTLSTIPAQTVKESEQLTFAFSGSDPDLPAQTLSFIIVNAPTGSSFDPTLRTFNWTPVEGQGSQTFKPSICVNDGVVTTPTCQEITITVESVNSEPTIDPITSQSADEGALLSFSVVAYDTDLPKQDLTYSFSGETPAGIQIDASTGTVTWRPSEEQGGNYFTVKICVSDGFLDACQSVDITVNEVNIAPILVAIPNQTAFEGAVLTFTVVGEDEDLPQQTLKFSLKDAPTGAAIDPDLGTFTWTPVEGQGSQTFRPSICVSDGVVTTPTCQEVTITVESVNSEPTVEEITAQKVDEGALLSFSVVAYDTDLPKQDLTYSFSGETPTGIQIDASTGVVTWWPNEEQGNQDFTVKVCVSDGVVNICQSVVITVKEVNVAPTLVAIPNQTVVEGELLTFTAEAEDEDLPQQTLEFRLENAPTGAEIDKDSGLFTWTPDGDSADQDFVVKVCVSDGSARTCQDLTIMVVSVVLPPTEFFLYLPMINR